MAAEVVGQGGGGDGGDGDFVEELGGCAGPMGSFVEKGGDGVQNGRGWVPVQGCEDGLFLIRESSDGPLSGIRET